MHTSQFRHAECLTGKKLAARDRREVLHFLYRHILKRMPKHSNATPRFPFFKVARTCVAELDHLFRTCLAIAEKDFGNTGLSFGSLLIEGAVQFVRKTLQRIL